MRMSAFTSLIQYGTGNSNHCNKVIKRNKDIQKWKEENKLVIFANYMIVYVGNSEEFTKNSI